MNGGLRSLSNEPTFPMNAYQEREFELTADG
jgi:hypothetical protein